MPKPRRLTEEFAELSGVLHGFSGEKAVFVPNPGNAGDSLIAAASYLFLDSLGLDYEIGDRQGVYPGRVLLVGGGGNLVPPYRSTMGLIERNSAAARAIVVLPHTIFAYDEAIDACGDRITVFCRERSSFDFVGQRCPRASIRLSHDLAFNADFGEIAELESGLGHLIVANRRLAVRNLKRRVRAVGYRLLNTGRGAVLNAFREDIERTDIEKPFPNIDVSRGFAADDMSRAQSFAAAGWLARFVGSFRKVRTNRLHIAIVAAMLGKEVMLYPNSNGKNKAVYDHTFSRYFDNVVWNEH